MRFYYSVLLAAIAALASTNAMLTSKEVMAVKPTAIEENETPTKRFLRNGEKIDEDDEERLNFKALWQRVKDQTTKLAKYNVWIFNDRTPEWVAKYYPEFAKGYENFWNNRMIRGYKYA